MQIAYTSHGNKTNEATDSILKRFEKAIHLKPGGFKYRLFSLIHIFLCHQNGHFCTLPDINERLLLTYVEELLKLLTCICFKTIDCKAACCVRSIRFSVSLLLSCCIYPQNICLHLINCSLDHFLAMESALLLNPSKNRLFLQCTNTVTVAAKAFNKLPLRCLTSLTPNHSTK